MKNIFLFSLAFSFLVVSCSSEKSKNDGEKTIKKKKEIVKTFPFTHFDFTNLNNFKPTGANWKIVESVIADTKKRKTISFEKGTGVLLNTNDQEKNKNLFTTFSHGDIELELDVLMPLKSNSGLYFQSRYEIQLLDSWGVQHPKHGDMAGVYQRWNKKAPTKKEKGYEGTPPRINAAKAPGLWQHLKIIFHAPKFDAQGNKVKNAWFEEVRLNGILVQEDVELSGPTRGFLEDEVAMAPLMIQGDHGPVAFKNVKYKLYQEQKITINKSELKIYDNSGKKFKVKNLGDFNLLEKHQTDSISPLTRINKRDQKITAYKGTINIPFTGKYIIETSINGGTYFIIDKDTIINQNKNRWKANQYFKTVQLTKGTFPYEFVYNKAVTWRGGFDFFIEGPNIQKYSLLKTSTNSLSKTKPLKQITLDVKDKALTQRSFVMHKGIKRSHCISVGLLGDVSYTLDLENATLLQIWSRGFFNATQMWHSRGLTQIGTPIGPVVTIHGTIDFAFLEDKNTPWPTKETAKNKIKQLGYKLGTHDIPTFSSEIDNNVITNTFVATKDIKRGLTRTITLDTKETLWHKLAEGETIKSLPDNKFVVNNESYYLQLPNNDKYATVLRNVNGKQELLMKIPEGKNTVQYNIIW